MIGDENDSKIHVDPQPSSEFNDVLTKAYRVTADSDSASLAQQSNDPKLMPVMSQTVSSVDNDFISEESDSLV